MTQHYTRSTVSVAFWKLGVALHLWWSHGAWWHGEKSYMRFGLGTAWSMAEDIWEFRQEQIEARRQGDFSLYV